MEAKLISYSKDKSGLSYESGVVKFGDELFSFRKFKKAKKGVALKDICAKLYEKGARKMIVSANFISIKKKDFIGGLTIQPVA